MSEAARGRVDVAIVAYNAGELLDEAVRSAAEQAGEARVVVVDVGSTDGSVPRIAERFPNARVIAAENLGFSHGNNVAIEATAGEFVLLLNPDAELRPAALGTLLEAADANPRAAVVGPAVLNPDGSLQANSYGRFPSLSQVVGLRLWRMLQQTAGNTTLSPWRPTVPTSVDWVTGACMLVRRDAIREVGAMDAGYFLYYEDVDWCKRMRDAGWEVVLEPRAECVHHLGASGGGSERVQRAYRESFRRYARKNRLWGLLVLGSLAASARKLAGGRR